MNKLERESNKEYSYVLGEFKKLLDGFLLKKEVEPYFVGGIPVTMTKDNLIELLDISYKYNDYKYTATAKVDGTRFLCFITEGSPTATEKTVYFIDRSMDIFTLVSKNNVPFNKVKLPKMLLDGEMIFFKDKRGYFNLPQRETESLSFMVFDILFGPSDLYFRDIFTETEPHFKESVAMSGPVGGPRWDYRSRYSVLTKLFVPSNDNNYLPPLPMKSINSEFFRFELKSILSVRFFAGSNDLEKVVQDQFKSNRKSYYDFLIGKTTNTKLNNINKNIKNAKIDFDGIIFTPLDTEYVFGSWNNYKNFLYKWKPSNEQTVDFKIKKTNDIVTISGTSQAFVKVKVLFRRFDKRTKSDQYIEWSPGKNEPRFGIVPKETTINDGSICEFTIDLENNYFIFSRVRELKGANALLTIKSVIDVVKNPVKINILGNILSEEPKSEKVKLNMLTALADTLTKEQKLKLLICLDKIQLIDEDTENSIKSFIDEIKEYVTLKPLDEDEAKKPFFKEMHEEMFKRGVSLIVQSPPANELIVYLGKNISLDAYQKFIVMMETINWKSSTVFDRSYTSDNVDTTQRFIPELNSFVNIYARKTLSQEDLTVKTNGIGVGNIQFSKNRYSYLNYPDVYEYDEIVKSNKIIFYDPNERINVICERVQVVQNTFEISSPGSKPAREIDLNYKYNIYIQESSYYSIDYQSIYSFIKFYLNF